MKVDEASVFGVTLRTSEHNPSSLAVLDHQSRICNLGPFYADDELLQMAEAWQPALIAIGSPLCLPNGLADLEPSSGDDAAPPENRGRQLERELANIGISCFFTGRGSVIRQLIYRGIEIKSQLNLLGYEVIEVYLHAARVVLFGDQAVPRKSYRVAAFLRERLPALINGMEPYIKGLDKHSGDALLNAYTALLHIRVGTDILGDPHEGLLVIPKLAQ
jgi:predicted nuclease with RNAse H fold